VSAVDTAKDVCFTSRNVSPKYMRTSMRLTFIQQLEVRPLDWPEKVVGGRPMQVTPRNEVQTNLAWHA
jgi:hypothetical protein